MPVGYHVDRSNQLEEGDTLDLEDEPFLNSEDKVIPDITEVNTVMDEYSDGLSRHGSRYAYMKVGLNTDIPIPSNDPTKPLIGEWRLMNSKTGELKQGSAKPTEPIYEWVFELVRKSDFPDLPSRFQSVFGFETKEDAIAFRSDYETEAQIVQIVYNDAHKADMDLLEADSFAHGLHHASTYWQGEPGSDDPTWELVLQPPVDVVEIVDTH